MMVVLYNPNVDYSAPLQQEINAELIGSHPNAQQYQKQQPSSQSQQVRNASNNNNSGSNNNNNGMRLTYNNNASSTAATAAAASSSSSTNTAGAGSVANTANTSIVNNLALKLSEQCNVSKLSNNSSATTANNTNNFNLNEFNAMKTHSAVMATTVVPQQQQTIVGPQLGLMQQNNNTNDNSINNLLISNNVNNHLTMNSKVWSSQHQQQQSQQQQQQQPQPQLQHLQQQQQQQQQSNQNMNLYQNSSNTFQMETMNNHCSDAMISSLWGSESSSSGCSSGSGSQPSLSPTLLNSAPNYRSNSKESLWSQQTSPSTSSSGCSSQLRDTYYTGSSKLSITTTSPTSWSTNNTQQNHALLYETNEMNFAKINNIWEIPQTANGNATASNGTGGCVVTNQDLFPEIWTNLNGNHHVTDNVSDISSNTSSSNNDNDIWRTTPLMGHQGHGAMMAGVGGGQAVASHHLPLPQKATMFGNANTTNLHMNENNHSGLGAAACMQLFSDEFLFM